MPKSMHSKLHLLEAVAWCPSVFFFFFFPNIPVHAVVFCKNKYSRISVILISHGGNKSKIFIINNKVKQK